MVSSGPTSEGSQPEGKVRDRFCAIGGVALLLIGCLVLAGWIFDIEILRSMVPGFRATKPDTALAFSLAGISLWLLRVERKVGGPGRWKIIVSRGGALSVGLLGLAGLAGRVLGLDPPVLWLGSVLRLRFAGSPYPAYMGLATGFDLLLLGGALFLIDAETASGQRPARYLALGAAFISLLVLGGLGNSVGLFSSIDTDPRVAPFSALGMSVLILSVFFARADRGFMKFVLEDQRNRLMLLGLLLTAIVASTVGDVLTLAVFQTDRQQIAGLITLLTAGLICVFSAFILWSTVRVGQANRERHRAHVSLESAEQRYWNLFDRSPNPMWVCDEDTLQFLAVNEAAITVYGYDRNEFHALTFRELVAFESRPRFPDAAALVTMLLQSGRRWEHEKKNGSRIAAEIYSQRIVWKGHSALLVQALDVTERERAVELLRQREERFRQMADNIQEVFWMLDAMTLRVIYASPGYETMTGRTVESLYADPLSYRDILHPEEKQAVLAKLDEALLSRSFHEEFRVVHTDGTVRWVWVNGYPVRSGKGHPDVLVGTAQDITQQKEAQRKLQQTEADYRALVESAPYGIMRVTAGGKLAVVNPALVRMLGYASEEELLRAELGTHIYRNPGDRKKFMELIGQKPEFENVEAHWRRKDGTPLVVRGSGRTIRDDRGEILYLEAMIQDVTQERALEDALRQSQKMEAIGQLAGGIAHDFNNLLTIILGKSDFLLQRTESSDPRHSGLREIRQAADRARWLTAQLLIYSRRHTMELKLIDPNALLQELRELFDRLIGEDIVLTTELTPALGSIKTDRGLLQQAIMNLVVNARDAMPEGGTLGIKTQHVEVGERSPQLRVPAGSYVCISVSDTGMGMTAEVLAHIFEPFFTTKGPDKGTGLGLAMVHSIVEQSRGHVTVQSEPGQGSTFSIYLPRELEAPPSPAPDQLEEDAPPGWETCLVVEDSAVVRALTRDFLSDRGYKVLVASTGEQALEIAREFEGLIHLLVSDVVMPGLSGPELASTLTSSHPEMKVLLVSGHADETTMRHGVQAPTTSLLAKPFTQSTLLRKVREILDGQMPARGNSPQPGAHR